MRMEQIPLDLGIPKDPESKEVAIETLKDEELGALYYKAVGKDPIPRSLDRAALIAGIQDPKAELERLAAIDSEADKEDLKRPYAGR